MGFAKTYGPLEGWQKLFYNAWGVTKWTTNRIINSYYDNGFVANRKIREDKGLTLVNSAKKRKSTYTPLYVYKREQTQKRYRTHTLRLDAKTLKEEFENKHEDEQVVYRNIADNFKHQGFSLHHNIVKLLKKTGGCMSYEAIANQLGGIVTKNTVAKHLNSLDGFLVAKSRILPQLSKDCMERRKRFCEAFFIFWHSAKCLKSKIKLIVTHMDEKWVHAVVTRTNVKLLENYNAGKRFHYAHHKITLTK